MDPAAAPRGNDAARPRDDAARAEAEDAAMQARQTPAAPPPAGAGGAGHVMLHALPPGSWVWPLWLPVGGPAVRMCMHGVGRRAAVQRLQLMLVRGAAAGDVFGGAGAGAGAAEGVEGSSALLWHRVVDADASGAFRWGSVGGVL